MSMKDPKSTPETARSEADTPPGAQSPPFDGTLRLLTRFERFAWDIGGVIALAFTLMTLLALVLPQLTRGVLLSWWAGKLQLWFGWGSIWVIVTTGVLGLWMLRQRHTIEVPQVRWGRVLALEMAAFASLALLSVLGGTSLKNAEAGLDGGVIGWGLAELLRLILQPIGLSAAFWRALLVGAIFVISSITGLGLVAPLAAWAGKSELEPELSGADAVGANPVVSEAPLPGQEAAASVEKSSRKKRLPLPAQFRKNFRLQPEDAEKPSNPPLRDDRLPPLDLLINEQSVRPDERNINLTAGLIEKTLAEFGIPAKVVGFRIGPTVTQFAVEPGFVEKEKSGGEGDINRQKVRVAQISALGRDLALALSAERLRIEAPVPGRPYVGIEVPNSRSTVVRLRPILEAEAFYKVNSPLAIGLGRDVSGQPVVADLSRMPHLLIAGTTGSGKSVCIAALTTCLVMNNTPEDLQLVMVDPKMVELVRFNGLPHLLGKVETDLERILAVLRWTVAEMDRRYKILETSRSRNIDSYNRKARRRKGEQPLPRIVVMIDELADLMMSAPDQTEHNLVRLAQMARATGFHLVVATQRPSTDVVTGLIKANFPARISFAVASSVDSRVILDGQGAESLLGRGDMLFLQPEASAPIRSQGAMVSDHEIERVITFWQQAIPEQADAVTPWDEMLEQEAMLADRDDLIQQAVRLVQDTQKASASMLQRRLRIGYPRAARLIDELEDLGVVGPSQGGGREREVLFGPDDELDLRPTKPQ
jgi:S-DNA-T family DNA segregation ATPase FtsK/SpoIIIE